MVEETVIQKILTKNQFDEATKVSLFSGGQINSVYQIGEALVLKIENELDVTPHQPEIMSLALRAGAKVPKILDFGQIDGKRYLLMSKISGRKLSEDWFSFSDEQKENLIRQIVEQLKIFHSIGFAKYSSRRPNEFDNWETAIDWLTNLDRIEVDKIAGRHREDFELVRDFYLSHKQLLYDSDPPVLVHNDLHFENILHEGGELTGIIDFDFARQAPKDYELWHLLDSLRVPKYFVEEKLEKSWENFKVGQEIAWFKKYYPELFEKKDLITRIKLYITEDIIGDLLDGASDKFHQKVDDYFRNDWLEKNLF